MWTVYKSIKYQNYLKATGQIGERLRENGLRKREQKIMQTYK